MHVNARPIASSPQAKVKTVYRAHDLGKGTWYLVEVPDFSQIHVITPVLWRMS